MDKDIIVVLRISNKLQGHGIPLTSLIKSQFYLDANLLEKEEANNDKEEKERIRSAEIIEIDPEEIAIELEDKCRVVHNQDEEYVLVDIDGTFNYE